MQYGLMIFFKCKEESIETICRWICSAVGITYDKEQKIYYANKTGEYSFLLDTKKELRKAISDIDKLSLSDIQFLPIKLDSDGSWGPVRL